MRKLLADALASDRRVADGKRLILEALAEHQSRLTGPRAADPALQLTYDEAIDRFGKIRGGGLYYPYLGSGFGKGALVELADGSVKYDLITGIGVHGLGHGHRALVEAGLDAALVDTVMQGNLQQGRESLELAGKLVDLAGAGDSRLEHCFLTTSGAMANENALKMLFQKRSPAHRLLAFEGCFMGRTLALAQVTDKPAYRAGLPPTLVVDYVPFFDPDEPEESTERALAILRWHLDRYPGQYAAMSFELVLGEGGYYPGDSRFFTVLMEELRSQGVAIMVDEVQTFGRTSRLFAHQHFGLERFVDVVTIGKLSQVCATLFTGDLKPKPGLISQTFTGSTASILAAKRVIEELAEGACLGDDGKNLKLHNAMVQRLEAIAAKHPGSVSGPYGIGSMVAFTPWDGSIERTKALARAMFDAGVIGFMAGTDPARIRFLLPVAVLTESDIGPVGDIIETCLIQAGQSP